MTLPYDGIYDKRQFMLFSIVPHRVAEHKEKFSLQVDIILL